MSTPEERIKLWRQEQGAAERRRIWAQEQAQRQPPQPQAETWGQWFRRNIGLPAEQAYASLGGKVGALGEIVAGVTTGDFRPLLEAGETAGRGLLTVASAFDPAGAAYEPTAREQGAAIQAIEQRQTARRRAGGEGFFERTAAHKAALEREAALDPSLSGRISRGVIRGGVEALPVVGAGVLSGGSIPVMAGVGALSSIDEPESIPLSAGLGAVPLPIGQAAKAVVGPVIRKAFGRGAAEIIEAEARAAAPAAGRVVTGAVDDAARIRAGGIAPALEMESLPTLHGVAPSISSQIRATGVAAEAPAIRAAAASLPSDSLNAAITQAASEVPEKAWRRALGELASAPRALMSSLDISAPGRQGAILSFAPSRWGDALKAGARMFQSFKPQHYERITKEIASHADAGAAQDAGLYLAFREGAEELFTSRIAAKVPGVVRSQRMYETYLDSLRLSTFSSYKKIIDAQALTMGQREAAYKAAAQWVNIATGRGSLGKGFDKAVPLLSQFIFAPRYTASRFNVLNPKMYISNFRDPATRAVAKRQMRDLAEYVGVVGVTMGLFKLAGADVTLSPSSPDFLKIKVGTKRFDLGAGLQQVMRLAIRTTHDLYRAAKGEKAEHGQDVGSIALRFLRSKAAPVPSYFADFFTRKTYEGRKFTATEAGRGVLERVTPLAWSDFTEALLTEGLGQAAMTLPGAAGIGVQSFGDDATNAAIEKLQPLLVEYGRFQKSIPEVHKAKDESDAEFAARRQVYGEAISHYGLGLLDSPEYKGADEATKQRALDLLPRRISSALMRQGEAWQLQPRVLLFDARDSLQQQQQQREPRRLYDAQGQRLR